jgi:hypothetical protein
MRPRVRRRAALGCPPPTGSGCRPRPATPALVAGGDQNGPQTARPSEQVITPHRRTQLNPDGEHRARPHVPAAQAQDRPGRGDALFRLAWSRWPLTAPAGGCVLAVVLATFEDHEVTHQAVDAGVGLGRQRPGRGVCPGRGVVEFVGAPRQRPRIPEIQPAHRGADQIPPNSTSCTRCRAVPLRRGLPGSPGRPGRPCSPVGPARPREPFPLAAATSVPLLRRPAVDGELENWAGSNALPDR